MGVLMELSISFLRKNPDKLCFIELSQNFCDRLSEPENIYQKGKPEALPYLPKKFVCFSFYQHKREMLAFQPIQKNQYRQLN